MLWSLVLIAAGVAALAYSSDWFVDGAAVLADRLSVPPVVIGTLVIGLGTSLPEVFVSTLAAVDGDVNLGIGNIVGSNTANLTLVLGVAATISLVRVDSDIVRREAPLMLVACLAVAGLAWTRLTVPGGLVLLAGLVGYLVLTATMARRSRNDRLIADVEEYTRAEHRYPLWMEVGRTLIGLVGTVAAARALVVGAVDVADRLGWSGGFVGLTLVALGTSLPELAAAIQAVRRHEDELLVGNLVGSNILNSLLVGGLVGVVGRGVEPTSDVLHRGMLVMAVSVAAITALMVTRARFERTSGAILVTAYVAAMLGLAPY
ncbi:MAG: calcium/sodium antiporter [Microthrixaceae bacterium]|nr:calcium/sodium antiporter [Microthrixaceae bacterium]